MMMMMMMMMTTMTTILGRIIEEKYNFVEFYSKNSSMN
jgi:hypothetical protein